MVKARSEGIFKGGVSILIRVIRNLLFFLWAIFPSIRVTSLLLIFRLLLRKL
uniref:Uncharacterized protein n=1 Tax=Anguilla anguilla TaxID=7936 RepID=A0A0E9WAJ3_ANGAN